MPITYPAYFLRFVQSASPLYSALSRNLLPIMNSYPNDIIYSVMLAEIGDKFLVQAPERSFHVGRSLYYILKLAKERQSPVAIQAQLAVMGHGTFSIETIEKALNDAVAQMTALPASTPGQRYIHRRFKLLNEHGLSRLATPLRLLFNRYSFLLLLVGSGYLSFRYGADLFEQGLFQDKVSWADGLLLVLSGYLFLGFVSFTHELGHAAAALRYGIRPKEIGVGFYLVFPVLYTDLTRIWILNRLRRVVVNLSGIYIQLLINSILIGIDTITNSSTLHHILHSLYLANTFLVVYSLNPYLRNDGYWIVSDLFDIPNLSRHAFELPRRLISSVRQQGSLWPIGIRSGMQRRILAAYTALYWFMLALLPLGLYQLSMIRYAQITALFVQMPTLSGGAYYETIWTIIRLVGLYGLILYVSIRMAILTVKSYRTAA